MATSAAEADFYRHLVTTGKSFETARTYSTGARIFLRWCSAHETDPDCLDRGGVEHFLADQLAHVTRTTARNRLYAARAYLDFLGTRGTERPNPTAGIRIKRNKSLPKPPVDLTDQRRLAFNTKSVRDEAIVMMLIDTGIRIGELASMKIENVRWQDQCVLIDGKGGKQREVWPGPETMGLLRTVAAGRRRGPLWLTKDGQPMTTKRARQNFDRLATRSRVDAHPHKLRATFAQNWLKDGGDLGALRVAMGHADLSTTLAYAAATEKDRAMETARRLNLAGRLLA